jgi:hypothetical protein
MRTTERITRRGGYVRPFVEADIPQVAELHRRVFQTGDAPSAELERRYRAYLRGIFLDNPWYDEEVSPLVYEDADGSIAGFLGVMPRRMSIRGRPIQAAVSSQFIVEPGRRSTMAAVHLMKTFMSGPQDVSISDEANCPVTQAVGEPRRRHGVAPQHPLGAPSAARSVRPPEMGSGTRRGPQSVVRPVCRLVDGVAAHLPPEPVPAPGDITVQ